MVISERYELLEEIGRGAMASVYKAYDRKLMRMVAVKFVRNDNITPAVYNRLLRRFEREVHSLAKLFHANIAPVYDYGSINGRPYLVMALLEGGTLQARMNGPIDYREAARILAPIADALSYAHKAGIIHRDVKPSNIIFKDENMPLLADFGIAHLNDSSEGTLTVEGTGVGTPAYMAPEQIGKQYDGRVDQYALGIVFYEMITGQKPFMADTPLETMYLHRTHSLPDPRNYVPGLPSEITRLFMIVLAKDPEDRFRDISEFAEILREIYRGGNSLSIFDSYDKKRKHLSQVPGERNTDTTYDQLEFDQHQDRNIIKQKGLLAHRKNIALVIIGTILLVALFGFGLFIVGRIINNSLSVSKSTSQAGELIIEQTDTIISQSNEISKTETATVVPQETIVTMNQRTEQPTAEATQEAAIIDQNGVRYLDGMEMVYISEGVFGMGTEDSSISKVNSLSTFDDKGWKWWVPEQPYHEVYLDGYWLDRYEISNAQFALCVAKGPCQPPEEIRSNLHSIYYEDVKYTNYPVINVNWYDAQTYCEWVGGRLPTEAEWEKAAKGSTAGMFTWGDQSPDCKLVNFYGCEGDTMPVDSYSKSANSYGVFNMNGNVKEWIGDWYADEYYAQSPNENPKGPDEGDSRGTRGGSWDTDDFFLRTAYRSPASPDLSSNEIGFRCVLVP